MKYVEELTKNIAVADDKIEELQLKIHNLEMQNAEDLKIEQLKLKIHNLEMQKAVADRKIEQLKLKIHNLEMQKPEDYKIEKLKHKINDLEIKKSEDLQLMQLLSDKAWSSREGLNGTAIFGFAYEHLYLQRSSSISREFIVNKLSEYCGYKFNGRSPVQWGIILGEIEKRFDNDPHITREYKNNKEFLRGIYYSGYVMPSDNDEE